MCDYEWTDELVSTNPKKRKKSCARGKAQWRDTMLCTSPLTRPSFSGWVICQLRQKMPEEYLVFMYRYVALFLVFLVTYIFKFAALSGKRTRYEALESFVINTKW